MFETGLDYEVYEMEYKEVLAFADEEGNESENLLEIFRNS